MAVHLKPSAATTPVLSAGPAPKSRTRDPGGSRRATVRLLQMSARDLDVIREREAVEDLIPSVLQFGFADWHTAHYSRLTGIFAHSV
jgi:hypothetical protein